MSRTTITHQQVREWYETERPRASTYSLTEIILDNDERIEFTTKASPSVVPHLVKEMHATGFLTLWNDVDTLCVSAKRIKHFTMRELTKQPTEK